MRLSDHIKNRKTAPAPARRPAAPGVQPQLSERSGWAGNAIPTSSRLQEVGIGIAGGPATAAQDAPGAATAPAYSADLPAPAIAGFAKAGVAWATKAGSRKTPVSSSPSAQKNLFRLSDLMMKKRAAPKSAPVPVVEHVPEPVPEPMPVAEHTPEPLPAGMVSRAPEEKACPGPARAPDAAPARPPTAPGVPAHIAARSVAGGQQLQADNAIPTSSRLQEIGIGIAGGPATAEQDAPGAATAPAYSADLPAPAIAGFAKAGVAWATKAGSRKTPVSSSPSAQKNLFRLSDLMMKKRAAPKSAPVPVVEHVPEPAPEPMPVAEHTPEPLPAGMVSRAPEEKACPSPARAPDAAPGVQPRLFERSGQADNAIPTSSRLQEVGIGIAGGPAKAPAASEGTADVSRYEKQPACIYEICRQFGIAVPGDRTATIEQARTCLTTIFKKILLPTPEKYMIWPMIKSIASDLDGIIADDANILAILHRCRAKEEKLVWHSLYTAILAMDLARNEKNLPCSVYEMGGAALLHDVGLLLQADGYNAVENEDAADIPDQINKGIELAREIEVPAIVLTMISQHYGRLDGRGFPKDFSRSKFERCSQILAIANIFEHAVVELSAENKKAVSEDAGEDTIAKIFRAYSRAFDIDLLKKMIALVGFFPAGTMVELNNRAICKVVRQNNDFPLRPVVNVVIDGTGMHAENGKLIDLKETKILSILRSIASPQRKTKRE